MNQAIMFGIIAVLSMLVLPVGVWLRFGFANGLIALGLMFIGHFLLQFYVLNRTVKPHVEHE